MSVTPENIAVALGRTAPDPAAAEYAQWEMFISDALLLIEHRLGDQFAGLDEAKLDYVVREAVVAHIRHPDDATQVAVSVDDGSVSRTYKSGRGRVTISDDLWVLLIPDEDGSGAFTVDTVGISSPHLAWCALAFGATYCSCGVDIAGYPIFETFGIGG
jgi:hypothetical protein